jgi:hypothetical protein
LTYMLLQSIKLRNQKFFFFFNFIANHTSHLGHLPLRTNNRFSPWKLNNLNILKDPIEFLLFFFKKNW